MIINLLRTLRVAAVLCIRRANLDIPEFELIIEGDHWRLSFPEGWLKTHPLLSAELSNESWLQHKAGWELSCD